MSKKIGATGEFPEGKFHSSDEGALKFAVANRDGKVVLLFGTPVTWMAMGPEQAREVAQNLIKHASEAEKDYQ